MGFSGSGGLAASSSNCCCGRSGGRSSMSHSKKRSHAHPHETLCDATTKAETTMAEGFLLGQKVSGRLRLRKDGERESCLNIPCAALAYPRHPASGW